MFDPYVLAIPDEDIERAFKHLRGLRSHDAIRVLKTWANGWCTSGRFHETVHLPCLFGCVGARDEQSHYCMCPYLYATQSYLWHPSEGSNNPICRLGLLRPELNCLGMVACTFSACHHLKFTNAARFQSSGDLDPLQPFTQQLQLQLLGSFAEVFKTEAIELGCFARSFDPVEFTRYVNGQCALDLPQ